MIVRKYTSSDAPAIDEIYERCHLGTFGRPNLNHVLDAVVVTEDNGKIIGFGCTEKIIEAVMILDLDRSQRDKVAALNYLIARAELSAVMNGYERFYCFPSNINFSDILIKHYYMDKTGPILVKQLEGDNGE